MNSPLGAGAPATNHILHRTYDKPVEFRGWLLSHAAVVQDVSTIEWTTFAQLYRTVGGSYIWWYGKAAGQLSVSGEDLQRLADVEAAEYIDRVDVKVIESHEATAETVWARRPTTNRAVEEVVAKAWWKATKVDPLLADEAADRIA